MKGLDYKSKSLLPLLLPCQLLLSLFTAQQRAFNLFSPTTKCKILPQPENKRFIKTYRYAHHMEAHQRWDYGLCCAPGYGTRHQAVQHQYRLKFLGCASCSLSLPCLPSSHSCQTEWSQAKWMHLCGPGSTEPIGEVGGVVTMALKLNVPPSG